jgi:hypothetical protein
LDVSRSGAQITTVRAAGSADSIKALAALVDRASGFNRLLHIWRRLERKT